MDGIGEVQENGLAGLIDAESCIAPFLRGTRRDIAGNEVAEGGITTLQVIVAVFFRYLCRFQLPGTNSLGIFLFLGHPDAAIVTEALAHQREFALVVAVDGNASGVDLHIAGVGEGSSLAVAHPCCTAIAVHGVGGEIIEVAVSASCKHHGMGGIALQVAVDEVADNDASGAAFNHNQVHHFAARV